MLLSAIWRWFTLIVVCLLMLVSLALTPKALASPSTTQKITISVPATQPWTDTGIDIVDSDAVHISASGVIHIAASDPGKTPKGDPNCTPTGDFVAPNLVCWSLIAKIDGNAPLEVGSDLGFMAMEQGRLYLGVNDNVFDDNSGSWTATIRVRHSNG